MTLASEMDSEAPAVLVNSSSPDDDDLEGNYYFVNDSSLPKFEQLLWYRYDIYTSVALAVAYILVFLVGLAGNLLVTLAVLRGNREMSQCVTNIFLVNLAIADLLVIVTCLPFTLITNLIHPWILGGCICKLLPFLQGVAVCASVFTLTAVAVERCRSITSPLKRRMNAKTCRKVSALIWLAAVVLTCPWLGAFQQHTTGDNEMLVCSEVWPEPWMEFVYFLVAHLMIRFIVPLVTIFVSYILVFHRILRRQILSAASIETRATTRLLQRSKMRALRLLAAVVIAFFISFLPLYVTFTRLKLAAYLIGTEWVITSDTEVSFWLSVIPIVQWISSANSCVNPFIYNFFDPKFRSRFRQMLRLDPVTSDNYSTHHPPTTGVETAVNV